MIKSQIHIGLLLTLFLLFSCSEKKEKNTEVTTIKGKFTNAEKQIVYLDALAPNNIHRIDSVEIDNNGTFLFNVNVPEVSFYKLMLDRNNVIVLILNKQEEIRITADATHLERTYQVNGSDESKRLQVLNQYMNSFYRKQDSLGMIIKNYQVNNDEKGYNESVEQMISMGSKKTLFLRNFIDEKPATLASLAAVHQLTLEQDYEYFVKVEKDLQQTIPNSIYYKDFSEKLRAKKQLTIGDEAPEIMLNNPEDKLVSLYSLRGKVVLIDFWASWCKPCRIENPNVVKLYNKYYDKGFDIYGVSLDKEKTAWVNAIQQDGLTWTHVSDLGFWNSSAVKLYNISSIPSTYLIDKDGKIIAKDLKGKELSRKLEEIFGM